MIKEYQKSSGYTAMGKGSAGTTSSSRETANVKQQPSKIIGNTIFSNAKPIDAVRRPLTGMQAPTSRKYLNWMEKFYDSLKSEKNIRFNKFKSLLINTSKVHAPEFAAAQKKHGNTDWLVNTHNQLKKIQFSEVKFK